MLTIVNAWQIGHTELAAYPIFARCMKSTHTSDRGLIVIAFAAIYLIWGATYLLNHWALDAFPPFFLAGSRFFLAGLILGSFYVRRLGQLRLHQLINAATMGILLLAVGAGAITYALQYVDTGLTALMVAFEPLIVVFLMWLILHKRPSRMALIGCLLGVLGMYLLVSQKSIITDENTVYGMSLILISLFAWAFGSIYIAKLDMPTSKGLSSSLQMFAAGLVLMTASAIAGEDYAEMVNLMNWPSLLSYTVLIIFGSIVAYSAFNYLLIRSTPDKVATTTYVHPVVALLLGWAFNHEHISSQSLVAAATLLLGVFFINLGKRKLWSKAATVKVKQS